MCFSDLLGMQGIVAHKNGSLAAVWLELLVFAHYFERRRGPLGEFVCPERSGVPIGPPGNLRFSYGKVRILVF